MELHTNLRRVPIRRIGNRHNLFMGGDRELVMLAGIDRLCARLQRAGMARRHHRHAPVDLRFVPVAADGQIRSPDATGLPAPPPLQGLLRAARNALPQEQPNTRAAISMMAPTMANSLLGFLVLLIAALGTLFLAVLFSRVRAAGQARRLERHRSGDAGLSDLLNYAAMVDDGVLVGKNGAFMAAWLYQGEDNASASVEQRNLVSYRINQALSSLGSGWMIHVDAVRRPAPHYPQPGLSHFPDPVTTAMDEERRQLFESLGTMYEGHFVLTLTWFPPLLVQRKFVELMFEDDAAPPDHSARTQSLIEHFKRDCLSVESRLSEALTLTRLGASRVVAEGRPGGHARRLSALAAILRDRYRSSGAVAAQSHVPGSADRRPGIVGRGGSPYRGQIRAGGGD